MKKLIRLFPGVLLPALLFTACPPPVEDEVPKTTDTTDEDTPPEDDTPLLLTGTIWEWAITGIKLNFTTDTKVSVNGKLYDYTYDSNMRTGTADTLGAFTVDEDFLKLRFIDFWNLGEAVFDNLNGALSGTKWTLNQGVLEFTARKAKLHKISYDYSFDSAAREGSVNADYGAPGACTMSEDGTTLTFSSYRGSGIPVSWTKQSEAPAINTADLTGSDWWWDSTSLHLDFINSGTTLLWSFTGYYVPAITYDYTYNSGRGSITNGRNIVGAKYDLGTYSINGDVLSFVQYGPYPHGAVFYKQE